MTKPGKGCQKCPSAEVGDLLHIYDDGRVYEMGGRTGEAPHRVRAMSAWTPAGGWGEAEYMIAPDDLLRVNLRCGSCGARDFCVHARAEQVMSLKSQRRMTDETSIEHRVHARVIDLKTLRRLMVDIKMSGGES